MSPPLTGSLQPRLAVPALPLPNIDEPLVLYRKPPAAPPDFRSRYPAKKTKSAKRPPPSTPPVSPSTPEPVTSPPLALMTVPAVAAQCEVPPPAPVPAPPILLLSYQPAASKHLWFAQEPLPVCDSVDLLEPGLWADCVVAAAPRPAPIVLSVPTPEQERASATPLPRRAAITLWKAAGPLDAIGRWLRTRARRLALRIAPKRRSRPAELARLRAENAHLRQQIQALERLQA
ncbi:MAG: hypothetical protein ACKVOP_07905 [Sphingomonadaceae bacterium]